CLPDEADLLLRRGHHGRVPVARLARAQHDVDRSRRPHLVRGSSDAGVPGGDVAHRQNIYCRSDHANYARYGIPVVFFTTGGHANYHQVTDEPQYIQYNHMARVNQLDYDIALAVGNFDHRVAVDKPKPDSPFARSQQ
ncbi:MAG: M28 family peptidase, partial [bacterium]